jgi:hypothetical protein
VSDLTAVCSQFHGDVVTEESPGYDEARRPRDPGFQDVFPRVVLRCRSRSDAVAAVRSSDRLLGAQVVVADGSVVDCGQHEAGIEDAVAKAREIAGGKDIGLMGGGVVTAALEAGLVDHQVLHQVPVLLGGGHRFFQSLPAHVRLRLLEAVAAPGVTHLHYEAVR